jgi:hypothetical protein
MGIKAGGLYVIDLRQEAGFDLAAIIRDAMTIIRASSGVIHSRVLRTVRMVVNAPTPLARVSQYVWLSRTVSTDLTSVSRRLGWDRDDVVILAACVLVQQAAYARFVDHGITIGRGNAARVHEAFTRRIMWFAQRASLSGVVVSSYSGWPSLGARVRELISQAEEVWKGE